jgi:cysteine-rich repeat protein
MTRRWLIAASFAAHLAVVVALFLSGIWHLEQLHAERLPLDLVQPLRPPAPAAGGPVAAAAPKVIPKVIPKVVVQPPAAHQDLETKPMTGDREDGTTTGRGTGEAASACVENCSPGAAAEPVCGNGAVEIGEQCDDGNTTSGDGCSATCRTEPPPPPTVVAPNILQGLRISGETDVHPSTETASRMTRDNAQTVAAAILVCIATDGHVASATQNHSTGYADYDAKLLAAVRDWRYRPYTLGTGRPVPACSMVTFVYRSN